MKKETVIVHLSDLHFGRHNENAKEELMNKLIRESPFPDYIVVTGDLSQRGRFKELNEAKYYLEKIINGLKEKGHLAKYVVVPGNHDVGFKKSIKLWNKIFKKNDGNNKGLNDPKSLYSYYTKKKRPTAQGDAELALTLCEFYPERQIAFLKFNSNVLSNIFPWNYAKGGIGNSQLQSIKRILLDHETAFNEFKQCCKIALLHHHIQYLPNTKSDELMLMKDAGTFWKTMLDLGVEYVLHGHKHYQTHVTLRYSKPVGNSEIERKELMIISSGSSTSNDHPKGHNCSYYKIVCGLFHDTIWQVKYDGTQFLSEHNRAEHYYHVPKFSIPDTDYTIDVNLLEYTMVPEVDDLDKTHKYKDIDWGIDLDGELEDRKITYHGRYIYSGINDTNNVSTHIIVPIIAKGASRLSDIEPVAKDMITGKKLPNIELFGEVKKLDKFRLRIPFNKPISSKEKFKIELKFQIQSVMYRNRNDCDAIGFSRFQKGVEKFKYTVCTDLNVIEPQCYIIRKNGLKKLGVMEHKFTKKKNVLIMEIKKLKSLDLGFLFHYHRID